MRQEAMNEQDFASPAVLSKAPDAGNRTNDSGPILVKGVITHVQDYGF